MKSKNLILSLTGFIFGLFLFLLPSFVEGATCSALNYPVNRWQRVWYKVNNTNPRTFGDCYGDGPDEWGDTPLATISVDSIDFDNHWGYFGKPGGYAYAYVGFMSSRSIYINPAGTYHYELCSDDGSRLYIDGNLKIDNWSDHDWTCKTADIWLGKGVHQFRIDYYEWTGDNEISFTYARKTEGQYCDWYGASWGGGVGYWRCATADGKCGYIETSGIGSPQTVCLIGQECYASHVGEYYWNLQMSCTSEDTVCQAGSCPNYNGWDGKTCSVRRDDCSCYGCSNPFTVMNYGRWDAEDRKCVQCDYTTHKEIANCGDTQGIYLDCDYSNIRYAPCTGAADNLCESTCGASPECDEKAPGDSCGGIKICNNNCQCESGPAPDLIITNVWLDGSTIKYTIKNQGSASAGESRSYLYIDNVYKSSDPVSSLSVGASSDESFSYYTWTCSGTSDIIKVCADATNFVSESNEDNNCLEVTWLPDLIISSHNYSPSSPVAGDSMSFTGTVKNQGVCQAAASQTRLRIDKYNDGTYDIFPSNQSTGALNPGATESETWSNVWTCEEGTHKYEICTDATAVVTESNETNNCITQTFTCGSPPPPPPPPQPPSAPTASCQTNSSSQITVSWTNVTNESGYHIYRCSGSGCTPSTHVNSVDADVTSWANSGLAPNTTYGYKVDAWNSAGATESNTVYCTTQSLPCIRYPHTVTVFPNSTSSYPRGTRNYTGTITNNDTSGCDATLFVWYISYPDGWTGNYTPTSAYLGPGQSQNVQISITSAGNATARTYTLSFNVYKNFYGWVSSAFYYEVVTPPTLTVNSTPFMGCPAGHTDNGDGTCTFVVYSSTSDGFIWKSDFGYWYGYNYIWGDSIGVVFSSGSIEIGQAYYPTDGCYVIARAFLFFDTSSIPPNSTINSATLSLYGRWDYSDTDFSITIQNGQPTHPDDPLDQGDYYKDYYSGNGGSLTTAGFKTDGYNNITFKPTGLNWIQKGPGAKTKLALRSSREIAGTPPTGNEHVYVWSAEQTAQPERRPRLTVTYTPGVPITSTTGHSGITPYQTNILPGTSINLTAPSSYGGYNFSNWSNCTLTNQTTINFSMPPSNTTCTANYQIVNQPPDKPQPVGEGESWDNCSIQELSIPTFHWTYTDPDGDSQAASQVKIYGETTLDTGEISCPPTCTSYTPSNNWIDYNLNWGETYNWQVRVKDNQGNWSLWSDINSFTMPVHAYPWVNFSWTPQSPSVGELVQFTDRTTFYGGSSGSSWSWSFGDGGSSALQNPSHSYLAVGSYTVTLRACDNTPAANKGPYCCGAPEALNAQKSIQISPPLPKWKEIPPFIWLGKILAAISNFFNL